MSATTLLISFIVAAVVLFIIRAVKRTSASDVGQLLHSESPIVRDEARRLLRGIDGSPTGKTIQKVERVLSTMTERVGRDSINENDATKAASTFFALGLAIGFCYLDELQSDPDDVRAVVGGTMRSWKRNPQAASHFADHLKLYLDDEEFAGPIIDQAIEAVSNHKTDANAITDVYRSCLAKWRSFDVDAHDELFEKSIATYNEGKRPPAPTDATKAGPYPQS